MAESTRQFGTTRAVLGPERRFSMTHLTSFTIFFLGATAFSQPLTVTLVSGPQGVDLRDSLAHRRGSWTDRKEEPE